MYSVYRVTREYIKYLRPKLMNNPLVSGQYHLKRDKGGFSAGSLEKFDILIVDTITTASVYSRVHWFGP